MSLFVLKSSFRRAENVLSVYCSKSGRYVKRLSLPQGLALQQHCLSPRFISCSFLRSNYYDTLGVSRSATKQDIKNAYIELTKLYHPDKFLKKFGGYEVGKFLKIREAFDVLSNDTRRLEYDMETFGRSYDVNRFVSGEYRLHRKQFDDREPFRRDVNKDRSDAEAKNETNSNGDVPPETPQDRAQSRYLFDMLPKLYTVIFLLGVGMYFLGNWNRNRKHSNSDTESEKNEG